MLRMNPSSTPASPAASSLPELSSPGSHSFTSAVLDASDGNTMIAREAGGWKSAAMVEEVYGHTDVHDPVLAAALERTWEEQ